MEKRKKIKVLTLSKVFLKEHPRAGQPTYFKESIQLVLYPYHFTGPSRLDSVEYPKRHTIRATSNWPDVAEKINKGEMVLSIRQWSGAPYHSRQETPITELSHIGIKSITICDRVNEFQCYVGNELTPIETIANNDGLSKEDFIEWFRPYLKGSMRWEGVIIHFTNFRY